MIRISQATTVPTDVSRRVREAGQQATRTIGGGHQVQRLANPSVVSKDGIQAVNARLSSGFLSYRGGHRVQQQTFEPEVDRVALTGRIQSIADHNNAFGPGSQIQVAARKPPVAAEMISAAKSLASRLRKDPAPARAAQASNISRASAQRLLG